ncbi:hypothetical protein ACRALDRAFT_1040546 [Sodiomyces alcalophilus JCM 7366]|uniref:uncharacterized protein n=1 Tax=Sodiomyces alcalophilus JCM 7366 TaxID=591952 RepID=UPI0039B5D5A9
MTPSQARRRNRREIEDDDDEDSTRYESEGTSEHRDGPKRQRRRVVDEESSGDDAHDEELEDNTGQTAAIGGALGSADGETFQPGAIRRVKVENFVTYEKAEFFPGPNLNLVIGPNGTGKSSLVCAICLGLGFSPKHLGRAGNVKEFVKHGKPSASIEIELQKRDRDRRHHVIRVQIDRERNSQRWWINGRDSTHKAVQTLMRDLRIQVDNLCQFLPQDRVVEFAGSTPVDLLHETLRAAAPPQMLEWQQELRDMHRDHKELQKQSASHAENLANLEGRQQAMQADVDRLREREEVQARIADLRDAQIMAAYNKSRARHAEISEQLNQAKQHLRELENECAPSLEASNKKKEYCDAVAAAVQVRHAALRNTEEAANDLLNDVDNASDHVAQITATIEAETKSFATKRQELRVVNQRIGQLENRLKNRPPDFDPKEHNQKIRAHEHQIRELESEARGIQTKLRDVHQRGLQVRDERKRINLELQALDTQEGKQLKILERTFPDVARGWKWLRDNGDKFQNAVFGPPLISCSIKDKRYSDHVQALLQRDDFLCFTTQSREDHRALSNYFYKELGLSVSIRTCLQPLSSFKGPSPEEGRRLGFDAFAIEYLAGPEPVLAMLCGEKRLHMAGISLRDIDDEQYNRLMAEERIGTWAAGRQFYKVTRRKDLGPQAVSTMTRDIQPGRWWKDDVDLSEKRELQRQLDEVQEHFNGLKEENRQLQQQNDELNVERESKKKFLDDLKQQKSALQKEYNEYQTLPTKLENEKRSQEKKKGELEALRTTICDLEVELDDAIVKKGKAILRHQKSLAGIRGAQEALLEAQIREIEAKSDLGGLKDRNAAIMQRLENESRNVAKLDAAKRQAKQEGVRARDKLLKECVNLETRKDHLVELAGDKSPEEIEDEIRAEDAKLELIHAANPNVLRDFEKRARDIEKLRQRLETAQNKDDQVMRQITRLREKWEPKLEELVSRINDAFSYNFEQINCAGEVRIHKDEDFDQWALEIMVKFRENETLQQLNQHRQSGGERAVSTIFYLMALQSMAQSPFRVVDEINQGMDPRNERMVHERMVEIACRENTSQYFLITPKLLTGLRYDERMRVLCIASGEHMPVDGNKLDFGRCLTIHKRTIGAAA